MKGILSVYHPFGSFPLLNVIEKTVVGLERKFSTIFDSHFMCFTSNLNDERDSDHLASCVSGISHSFLLNKSSEREKIGIS